MRRIPLYTAILTSLGAAVVVASIGAAGHAGAATSTATAPATGDARTVTEPHLPASTCATLTATLSTSNRLFPDAAEKNPPDTARIQAALDNCAKGSTPGAVELKAGSGQNAFLTGPLTIGANTVLLVDTGVTVYGSRNPANYQVAGGPTCGTIAAPTTAFPFGCQPLIHVTGNNSGVMGTQNATGSQGLIDGRGDTQMLGQTQTWWQLAAAANGASGGKKQMNPRLIQTDGANNFTVYHISLANSPKMFVYLQNGSGITVWGVRISAPPGSARNTDGVDPAATTNVTITQSWIRDGDDGVAIKGDVLGTPAQNITISNNHFYGTHGISIGSETLGVRNVLVQNNTLDGADNGLRIKSNKTVGGQVSQVTYLDTCLNAVKQPLVFDPNYSTSSTISGATIPTFTDITVNGLKATNSSSAKSTFVGYDSSHPLGLTLENVNLDVNKVASAKNATISLYNSTITPSGSNVTVTRITGTGSVPTCTFPTFPGL